MKLEEIDYELPAVLIAKKPASPRDAAKMMVVKKETGKTTDSFFRDLGLFLKAGDVLVFNKTKVFPARIFGKKETGGGVEIVFLSETEPFVWEVVIGGKVSVGTKITFPGELWGEVVEKGSRLLKINLTKTKLFDYLDVYGKTPLPPYIKREEQKEDRTEYQTVFAETKGSAAAPTAGLHFTKKLLSELKDAGVQEEYITLHVGLGTFAPVKTEKVEDHPIHEEFFEIDRATAERINLAKKEGRRIIAVGTTVVRALESAAKEGQLTPLKTATKLFVYPGFEFSIIDGLITNFHTPHSSLLALVYAFAGTTVMREAYQRAIENKYRFFSYGDGMFII